MPLVDTLLSIDGFLFLAEEEEETPAAPLLLLLRGEASGVVACPPLRLASSSSAAPLLARRPLLLLPSRAVVPGKVSSSIKDRLPDGVGETLDSFSPLCPLPFLSLTA
jgi:hypothetical protein